GTAFGGGARGAAARQRAPPRRRTRRRQLRLLVCRAGGPVAAPVRPGLAQRAVRDRVRRAPARGPPRRRRPRPAGRALAAGASAPGAVPDGRPAGGGARGVVVAPRRRRLARAGGPVRRGRARAGGHAGVSADGIGAVVVTHCSEATIDDCLLRLRAADGVTAIRVVD